MWADQASDANEEEHPFSYHVQNNAIIAEPAGEIKGQATSPPLRQSFARSSQSTLYTASPAGRGKRLAGVVAPLWGAA